MVLTSRLVGSMSRRLTRAREEARLRFGDVLAEATRKNKSIRFDLQAEKEKTAQLAKTLEEEKARFARESTYLKEELLAARAENRELKKGCGKEGPAAGNNTTLSVDDLLRELSVARREKDETERHAAQEAERLRVESEEYLSRVDALCRSRFEKLKGHILDLRRERFPLVTTARYEGGCDLLGKAGVVVPQKVVDDYQKHRAYWAKTLAENKVRDLLDEDFYLFPRGMTSFMASHASSSGSKRARGSNP